MNIETKHFVATAADVEAIAAGVFQGDAAVTAGRATYLKALVATTQSELGAHPRVRTAKGGKISPEDRELHLKAFETVAARFGEAVTKAAKATGSPNAGQLRSMTGFARSAASTVRSHIRAFHDIRGLAAGAVTKRSIAVPHARRKLSAGVIRRRVLRMQDDLLHAAKNLMALNREQARETLTPLLAQLAKAIELDARPTKDAEVAVAEHRGMGHKDGRLCTHIAPMIVVVRLTSEQRACVLRAILSRRLELRSEIERLELLNRPSDLNVKVEILSNRNEFDCLQGATRALWGES